MGKTFQEDFSVSIIFYALKLETSRVGQRKVCVEEFRLFKCVHTVSSF